MAEHGEWNRKGAVLSEVTAQKEYGLTREFIVNGIQAGKLEYRQGAVWGNPYFRVLRSQLERYVSENLGQEYLESKKTRQNWMPSTRKLGNSNRNCPHLNCERPHFSAHTRLNAIHAILPRWSQIEI